jgi:alginate O-acetyltransferase complex protein AlgI
VLTIISQASVLQLDSLPNYPFINFEANKILQSDSNTLLGFYQKLWKFESQREGKVKILQIGDSHVQGGAWSGTVRNTIHDKFGCGVTERGFVFPYHMAGSNGPKDYKVEFTGEWHGCRSAFTEQSCSWGLAGFNASSNSDTLSMKLWAKQGENENYVFDQFDLYAQFDTASFNLRVGTDSALVKGFSYDSLADIYHFELNIAVDTLSVFFTRKNSLKDSVVIQGMYLGNGVDGITYSEAAVNGGKVQSFLASENFLRQLQDVSPDLLVISLGTNDTYSAEYKDSSFKAQYGFLLYQINRSLPGANIILTTPGDAQRYMKTHVSENIGARKIIIELAQKYNCAVWDWYSIMGGSNSIQEWKSYNLCAYDKVHLNDRGYELQGKLMYNALMCAYEKKVHDKRQEFYIINRGVNWKNFGEQFYLYSNEQPLLFNSPVFWAIFVVFFMVYLLLVNKLKLRSAYLLIFSLFFYYKTGGWYFGLLIFSTIVDYLMGWMIGKSIKNGARRFWLMLSLVVNLGLLGFFKYSYFIVDEINAYFGTKMEAVNVFYWFSNNYLDSSFDMSQIILPVGISFYTFQTMSYSIDIYRRKIAPLKSVIDFGFYVTFFPQLVAGPIVRASEFIPQIYQKYSLSKKQFSRATWLILGGLIKKIVISDYIAVNFVDRIFDAPLRYSGFENLLGIYGYALQIYCDFSAYSDIAIGLALLLGFTLPDNFNSPYSSTNITDFWRRWHMTLSRWLRDYLYITLGGSRKGKMRTLINLMLTMLIGGLWHGASIRFIIWGGLHGAGLVLHKIFLKLFPSLSSSKSYLWRMFSWFLTFQFVAFCWVFFRATNLNSYYEMIGQVKNVFYDWSTGEWTSVGHYLEVVLAIKDVLAIIVIGFMLHWIPKEWKLKGQELMGKLPLIVYPFVIVVVAILLFQFSKVELSPFIYFQF